MTYAVIQHRALDLAAGALLQNVDIRVRLEAPGLPLVALKADSAGVGSIDNPSTGGHFTDGKIRAYCVPGIYRIELLVSAVVVDTFYDVEVGGSLNVSSGEEGQFAYYPADGNAVSGSPVATIGPGIYGVLAAFPNNFNFYTAEDGDLGNGIMLSYGTGNGQGEGGGVNFITRNIDGSAVHAFQELGFVQCYWSPTGSPTYNFPNTPLAMVFGTTEAQTAIAQGSGVIFQIKTRGEVNARGELSIAEGVTASINATLLQIGLGRGTVNAEAGLYDNSKRALSASNPILTINQNSATALAVTNSTNNTGALANFTATSDVASVQLGAAATTFSSAFFAGRAFLYANTNVIVGSSGANGTIFAVNGAEAARFNGATPGQLTLGLAGTTVGKAAFANATSGTETIVPATGALGSGVATLPAGTYNLAGDTLTQEFTNKTLTSPVMKGTWTASGTVTLPAFTLGGTVSGGGNAINNLSTLAATTSLTSPLHIGGSGTTGTTLEHRNTSGNGTTDKQTFTGGNNGGTHIVSMLGTGKVGIGSAVGAQTPTNTVLVVSKNAAVSDAALPLGNQEVLAQLVGSDGNFPALVMDGFGSTGLPHIAFRSAGGTAATKTGTPSGAFVGAFLGYVYDTTNGYSTGPQISMKTTEACTSTAHGSDFHFFVVKNGTTAQLESLRLHQSTGVTVGSTSIATDPGADNLLVSGIAQAVSGVIPGSFTVAGLPAGATGKTVWCSNCRVFNGAGTQEAAAGGTGGLVSYNGSAWKIAGTNINAVA